MKLKKGGDCQCNIHVCTTLMSSIPCQVQDLAFRSVGMKDQVKDVRSSLGSTCGLSSQKRQMCQPIRIKRRQANQEQALRALVHFGEFNRIKMAKTELRYTVSHSVLSHPRKDVVGNDPTNVSHMVTFPQWCFVGPFEPQSPHNRRWVDHNN